MARVHLSPKLFSFLRDLAKHNDREWFKANKNRYEEDVKRPLLGLRPSTQWWQCCT